MDPNASLWRLKSVQEAESTKDYASLLTDPEGKNSFTISDEPKKHLRKETNRRTTLFKPLFFTFRLLSRLVRTMYVRSMANISSWRKTLTAVVLVSILLYMVTSFFGGGKEQSSLFLNRPRRGPFSGYRSCSPETRVAFLKTHKCASSTIQNVLLRYAHHHQLNVAMPAVGNYVGRYRPFHHSALWGTPWDAAGMQYDMYCLHGIWDQQEVSGLFQNVDPPVQFSILRDPVDLFISMWDYAKMENYYHISLEEYAMANKSLPVFRDRSKIKNLGRNQMLWDFGLKTRDFENEDLIRDKIDEVESNFDLILIAESFDESMLLLRELLCWSYEDVTSLKLNAVKSSLKSSLSEAARQSLRDWMWADYSLYNHFRAKFDATVLEFGEGKMKQQLGIFQTANSNVKKRCVKKEVDNQELEGKFHTWSNDVRGYQMKEESDDFCSLYGMSEIAFLDQLREEQGSRAEQVLSTRGEVFAVDPNRTAPADTDSRNNLASGFVLDPSRMRPLELVGTDGRPDIKRLKELFAHGKL